MQKNRGEMPSIESTDKKIVKFKVGDIVKISDEQVKYFADLHQVPTESIVAIGKVVGVGERLVVLCGDMNYMVEFDEAELYDGELPATEQTKESEYKTGDRVKLTKEKIQELKDNGFLEGFPSTEGSVSVATGGSISVDFGGSIRLVEEKDVERAEE